MTPQELRNSILQLAIQGKLVEQRPEEGTAEELYQKIQGVKDRLIQAGEKKKEKPLPEITEDEKPFLIPESWKWVRLGDFCIDIFSGKSPIYAKTVTPYRIIGQAANQQTGLDLQQVKYSIESFWKSMEQKYFLRKHDVLLNTLGNGTVGRSGYVTDDGEPLLTDGHLFIFRLLEEITSKYFYYYLQSRKTEIEKNASGSTNQTFLSLRKCILWIIPIPPLEEQKRIVAKIEELLPCIVRYEQAWNRLEDFNKRFPEDMKKSILQLAIQGKLVTQRPEEGTAEELYQQIQAEKLRLINAGRLKSESPLPKISESEMPFALPENWVWVRLLDIIEGKPSNGFSPKGVDYITSVKNLTLTATTSGRFKPDEFKYVDLILEPDSKYWLKHNDLLIQRSNSRELVGTSCVFSGEDNTYIYPDLMMRLRVMPQIVVDYLDYVLKAPLSRNYFMENASGTSESMPKINQKIVANTLIPLPPIAEQVRIVRKLKELLPLCDELGQRN